MKLIYNVLPFVDNFNDETSKQFKIKTNNPTSSSVSVKVYYIPY